MTDSATHPGVDDGKGKRGSFDWEAIERDYRAGVLSVREIAKAHGCDHALILRKAKAQKWERDLTGKVRKRVQTALITIGVTTDSTGGDNPAGDTPHTEQETVDAAAQTVVQVVKSHRRDVNRGRALVAMLMGQLADAADCRESIRDVIEEETSGDRSPNRRMAMLRAVAIPAHAGTVRDLAVAMKNLVAIERQAFNIEGREEEPTPPGTTEEAITDRSLAAVFVALSKIAGKPVTTEEESPPPVTNPGDTVTKDGDARPIH